jgi:hypothetical protein
MQVIIVAIHLSPEIEFGRYYLVLAEHPAGHTSRKEYSIHVRRMPPREPS